MSDSNEAVIKKVKCTRCRHVHLESDRKAGKQLRNGCTPWVCPKCGGHSMFYIQQEGDGNG